MGALYQVEKRDLSLTFRYQSSDLQIRRDVRMDRAFLSFRQETLTPSHAAWGLRLGPGLRMLDEREKKNRFLLSGDLAFFSGGRLSRVPAAKIKDPLKIGSETLAYAGLEDNYFTFMLLPQKGVGRCVASRRRTRGEAMC